MQRAYNRYADSGDRFREATLALVISEDYKNSSDAVILVTGVPLMHCPRRMGIRAALHRTVVRMLDTSWIAGILSGYHRIDRARRQN